MHGGALRLYAVASPTEGGGPTSRRRHPGYRVPAPTRRKLVELTLPRTVSVKEVLVMKLSGRFILDNLFVVSGAFLVAAALAFSAPVAGWIGFGVFTGLAVIAGTSAALARNTGRKAGHGLLALAALWSLIAALAFSGSVLMWLVLADAVLVGVIALADLAAHEVTTEKVVHQLVVTGTPAAANGHSTTAAERTAA